MKNRFIVAILLVAVIGAGASAVPISYISATTVPTSFTPGGGQFGQRGGDARHDVPDEREVLLDEPVLGGAAAARGAGKVHHPACCQFGAGHGDAQSQARGQDD